MIWPILKHEVKIAVETIKDPLKRFCPSSKHMEVIGTNVIPKRIQENIIPKIVLYYPEIKIPPPIMEQDKNNEISFPIFSPNQFQKNTEGIPNKPTTNQT